MGVRKRPILIVQFPATRVDQKIAFFEKTSVGNELLSFRVASGKKFRAKAGRRRIFFRAASLFLPRDPSGGFEEGFISSVKMAERGNRDFFANKLKAPSRLAAYSR